MSSMAWRSAARSSTIDPTDGWQGCIPCGCAPYLSHHLAIEKTLCRPQRDRFCRVFSNVKGILAFPSFNRMLPAKARGSPRRLLLWGTFGLLGYRHGMKLFTGFWMNIVPGSLQPSQPLIRFDRADRLSRRIPSELSSSSPLGMVSAVRRQSCITPAGLENEFCAGLRATKRVCTPANPAEKP